MKGSIIKIDWSQQELEATFWVDTQISDWDLGEIDWREFEIDKMELIIGSLGTDIITGLYTLRNRDGQMIQRAIIDPCWLYVQLRSPAQATDIKSISDVINAALETHVQESERSSS